MEGRGESGRGRDEREKRENKNIRDNRRIRLKGEDLMNVRIIMRRKIRMIKRGR